MIELGLKRISDVCVLGSVMIDLGLAWLAIVIFVLD
jgi:hypothetical protein